MTTIVERVIDGDTFETEDGRVIRLARVDAPELGTEEGQEAKLFLKRLIEGRTVAITEVATDRYGRVVAYANLVHGDGSVESINNAVEFEFGWSHG